MSAELPELSKAYEPANTEQAVSERWSESGAFHAVPGPDGDTTTPTYSVVIPPPNVTAPLHLGHALNNTLQDVLVRYHRMRGDNTMWMPGTDHAGIATQTVVEKRLLSQGIKRLDMGRDAFVEKTQQWKDEYEAVILSQMREMGASCDYERTRFTMDDICAAAVRHAFYILFRDGLIYRGKRLVNWDPVTGTALSDDEVEMEEVVGHMWYLRYPLEDGSGHVTVATTRPETMFGDTAVALNPADPRATELRGKNVVLPIVGRTIPIVEDDYVVMADPDGEVKAQYATGFLKVTPAHDPNDWEIGLRHDLPIVNVMASDASISDQHGWDEISADAQPFIGMGREDARTAVVDWFDEHDLLDEVRDYTHSVGHSYRSHAAIEPWLSDQWYVASTDDRLRGSALRAQATDQVPELPDADLIAADASGDGDLRFTPVRYAKTFQDWHVNIRDWCISRQLWWGHQIPVWNRSPALDALSDELRSGLAAIGLGETITVESDWSRAGAVHTARQVTDTEVMESICVPNDGTLQRLVRADSPISTVLTEAAIVESLEAAGFERDPDVLDSALWPMSTMGWPYPDDFRETQGLLDAFNPTSVLSTAREIITLWVSRMVMFNRYFLDGQLPFTDVFIHAMVQDGHGQKMSKSLGNGVDPRDIIFSHGADAMRFTLVQMTTDTQDIRMPVDLVCPHTGELFTPSFVTTDAGHVVAAPEQACPSDPSKLMVSAYGVAAGVVELSDDMPLARNTSTKFDGARNFSNKVWNAVRFAIGRLEGVEAPTTPIDPMNARFVDRFILARLHETQRTIDAAIAGYQFNVYADTLYDFIWHDVCDVYLEAVKPTIADNVAQQVILRSVIDVSLRLMHPACPFITEALWPHVSDPAMGTVVGLELGSSDLLATAAWPVIDDRLGDNDVVATFERTAKLISEIRTIRANQNVQPKRRITLHAPMPVLELLKRSEGLIETLAGLAQVTDIADGLPAISSPLAFEGSQIFVSGLVDEVDLDAERARLEKLIEAKTGQIKGFDAKLSNPGYVNNAKPELVAETRELLEVAQADLSAAQAGLDAL